MDYFEQLGVCRPKPPILVSEFSRMAAGFTLTERRALFFALFADLPLRRVIMLKRRDARALNHSFAQECLQFCPPHLFCEYLFWQQRAGKLALPLLGLDKRFAERTGLTWERFRKAHGRVIFYHPPKVNSTSHFEQGPQPL